MNLILAGTVVKPHGLDGAVLVRTDSGDQSSLAYVPQVFLGKNPTDCRPYPVLESAWMPKGWKVNLEGVDRFEDAQSLIGLQVFVLREDLEEPFEDEFYINDLEGMDAVDEHGNVVGKFLYAVSPAGAKSADLWWFRIGGQEVALPAVKKHILSVDLKNKRIVIAHWATAE